MRTRQDGTTAKPSLDQSITPAARQEVASPSTTDGFPRHLPYGGRPDLLHNLQRLAGNAAAAAAVPSVPALDALEAAIGAHVNAGDALTRITHLDAAARAALGQVGSHEALLRRVAHALSPAQLVSLFDAVPFSLIWKLKLLDASGKAGRLTPTQWSSVLTSSPPTDYVAMRLDAAAFHVYMAHVPAEMIGSWDKLEGLAGGLWHGSGPALLAVVDELSHDQKQTVNRRPEICRAVIAAAGSVEVAFRIADNLRMPLTVSVMELERVHFAARLSRQQWAQLLADATSTQLRDLQSDPFAGEVFRRRCPQAVRTEVPALRGVQGDLIDPWAGDHLRAELATPRQANALLARVGAAALLAMVTESEALANYTALSSAHVVDRVIEGLPNGRRLSDAGKAGLRKWMFEVNESSIQRLTKLFEHRFAVTASATGATRGRNNSTDPNSPVNIVSWTPASLRRVWGVLENLPPAQVEGNHRLATVLRDDANSAGNAYYAGGTNDVVLGFQNQPGELTGQSDTTNEVYWRRNPDGTFARDSKGLLIPAHGVAMTTFNQALRHEIGHAVDEDLHLMARNQANAAFGGWRNYASAAGFVDAVIASFGGMTMYPAAKRSVYRRAMIQCASEAKPRPFVTVLQGMDHSAIANPPANNGPISVFAAINAWSPGGNGPWYNQSAQVTAPDGRRYQRSYDGTDSFCSYIGAVRDTKSLTQYQWRSAAEWFAEVYAVYYSEQEQGATAAVGGVVRARDIEAARLMSAVVDRGYSPQLARNAALTVPAPGVGRADHGGP